MKYTIILFLLFAGKLQVSGDCTGCYNRECEVQCRNGCVTGFYGKTCQSQCQTTCLKSKCHLNSRGASECSIGCEPGYFGELCDVPCHNTTSDNKCDRHTGHSPVCDGSTFGNQCQHPCLEKCQPYTCDNEGTCNGTCPEGKFGQNCSQQCDLNCALCEKNSGECILCKEGFCGNDCSRTCPHCFPATMDVHFKTVSGCHEHQMKTDGTSPQPSLEGSADTDEMDRVNNDYSLATFIIVIIFIVSISIVKGVKITKRLCNRCRAQDKRQISDRSEETGPLLEMEDPVVSSNGENKIIQLQDKIRSLEEENLALKNKIDMDSQKARNEDKDTMILNNRNKSLEKDNEDLKRQVTENKNALEQRGITNYIKHHSLTTARNSRFISCVSFVFDKQNYNSKRVHIDEYEHLVNHPQPEQTNEAPRLKIYNGACSNLALPWSGYPQYFEIKAVIDIRKPLAANDLLLEIALARKEDHDMHHYVGNQLGSYSLTISHCTTHRSVCVNILQHGKHVICRPNIPNTRSFSLHYGLVYDHQYGRVGFLDVINNCFIYVLDRVDSTSVLWPMFGVYYSHHSTVKMSLVVGNEISMSEGKKVRIASSFASF